MLYSAYRPLAEVRLPYAGRQFYMHGFDLANPVMPEGYEDYLAPVTALLDAWRPNKSQRHGKAYMTVDEKIVPAGQTQRRPGPHVDGCYLEHRADWYHGPSEPGWNHSCNAVPLPRMPVIVASSVPGCRAWRGVFAAEPDAGGDLSHIADQLGEGKLLPANLGYLLSADCVHESVRFEQDTQRTFLRIALPPNG